MIFIDTGAFIARYIESDPHHAKARAAWERVLGDREGLATSMHVLAETATLLRMRADHSFVREVVADHFASRRLKKLRATPEDEARALQWFDKVRTASLVDAISFALMRAHRIERAFTFDADFHNAGFEVVPALERRSHRAR